jgi:regulator of sigma E protease
MNLAIAIASLIAIVVIHELGHFWVALAVGMRPRSFNVGFGPPLAKTERNGILYAFRALPLGGYVRLPGMTRPSARDIEVWMTRPVEEAPSLAPDVLAVRRALGAADYGAARTAYAGLAEDVADAKLSPTARRSAERVLRDIEEGTAQDAYWRAPTWKRISVILAGPLANVLTAFMILVVVFMVSGVSDGRGQATVAGVGTGKPAARAGMRAGDKVVAVNGKRAVTFNDVSRDIQTSNGRPITVTVVRAGRRLTLGPERATQDEHGQWIWGFASTTPLVPESFGPAARSAGDEMWATVTGTVKGLGSIFHPSTQSHLSTAVGISRAEASALGVSVSWFFEILALVSLSLGLMNLIPLLPLDGGHILMSLVESVRRRALAREVYERVSIVGIGLILLVLFIAFHNDPSQIIK